MVSAFVMISCDLGSTEEGLQKVKGVEEVAMVNGIYDIVVKISAANEEDLHRTNMRMRNIDKSPKYNDSDCFKKCVNNGHLF